jgi:fructoselysine 6-kinase
MVRSPLHIVSIGECTIDHYIDHQKDFVGGISLNFAVHCKRRGAEKVSLLTSLGKNSSSRILNLLERNGIDTSHIKVVEGRTACQKISVDTDGDRIFPPGGYDPGVLKSYQLQPQDIEFIQQQNLLASAIFKQLEPLFFQAIKIPFDGWRVVDFLDLSDYDNNISIVEKISEQLNIAFVSGDVDLIDRLGPLSRQSKCLFVITLGANGSAALQNGEPIFQPAIKVDHVLDSTGCGDAFQAAFTVSYWNERDLHKALHAGAENAATVLQHYGAIE